MQPVSRETPDNAGKKKMKRFSHNHKGGSLAKCSAFAAAWSSRARDEICGPVNLRSE